MRQEFKVVRPFTALAPISGTQRQFTVGEIVGCDTAQSGSTLTLEVSCAFTLFFVVERSVFEDCCKWISRNAGSI